MERRGRPPVPVSDRREWTITVRLTKDEFDAVAEDATADPEADGDVSKYTRGLYARARRRVGATWGRRR